MHSFVWTKHFKRAKASLMRALPLIGLPGWNPTTRSSTASSSKRASNALHAETCSHPNRPSVSININSGTSTKAATPAINQKCGSVEATFLETAKDYFNQFKEISAQKHWIYLQNYFNQKCGMAKESTVGVLAMAAGKGVSVLVTPTNDFSKVLSGMNGLQIGGEANLTAAIRVAQLALKNRKNKQLQQRIIVFVGSPVKDEKNLLEVIGKNLKRNNVDLDVVDFVESDDEKPEKLEALVAAVNSGGNSHIIHIPAGDVLSDVIFSSPILSEDRGSDSAATASGASGFQFGVDPNVDPELALALQISMEEERARQEAVAKKAREESSKTESEGQSSTSNGDIVMADTEPEPNSYTEDGRLLHMDEDELLRQAHEMSTEDFRCAELGGTDEAMSALQRAFQEEETGTQSDASKVFGDQPFAQSLPDVEFLKDLSKKDSLEWKELLIGPSEPKKQHKKYKRQKKKPEKKHEKKEDEPKGDN